MKSVSLILTLLFLASCSSRKIEQAKIDDKVSKETSVTDGKSLGASVNETIQSSASLTEQQKAELEKLFNETKLKNSALMEESFKLRAVLIKELLSGDVNPKQVKLLKKDIKKNESERLKSTLSAIDKISLIVSKDPDNSKFIDHMMQMDRSYR